MSLGVGVMLCFLRMFVFVFGIVGGRGGLLNLKDSIVVVVV